MKKFPCVSNFLYWHWDNDNIVQCQCGNLKEYAKHEPSPYHNQTQPTYLNVPSKFPIKLRIATIHFTLPDNIWTHFTVCVWCALVFYDVIIVIIIIIFIIIIIIIVIIIVITTIIVIIVIIMIIFIIVIIRIVCISLFGKRSELSLLSTDWTLIFMITIS